MKAEDEQIEATSEGRPARASAPPSREAKAAAATSFKHVVCVSSAAACSLESIALSPSTPACAGLLCPVLIIIHLYDVGCSKSAFCAWLLKCCLTMAQDEVSARGEVRQPRTILRWPRRGSRRPLAAAKQAPPEKNTEAPFSSATAALKPAAQDPQSGNAWEIGPSDKGSMSLRGRRASGPLEERLPADVELSTFVTSEEAAERGEELQPLGSSSTHSQVCTLVGKSACILRLSLHWDLIAYACSLVQSGQTFFAIPKALIHVDYDCDNDYWV